MSRLHHPSHVLLHGLLPSLLIVFGASACISAGRTGSRVVSPLAFENAPRGSAALRENARELRVRADERVAAVRPLVGATAVESNHSVLQKVETTNFTDPREQASAQAASRDVTLLESQALRSEAAAAQLDAASSAGETVYESGLFLTVEPLVAIGPGLEATAIPSLGVNWRFGDEGDTPLALQLVLGGALNPQSSDSSLGAAVGLGLSHPITKSGALSIGFVFWDDGDDVENGVYVSLNLGDFGQTAK